MVDLTSDPIDIQHLLSQVSSPRAGAIVLFLGTTREITGDRRTLSLDYEGYPEMALGKMRGLESEVRQQWPIVALEARRLVLIDKQFDAGNLIGTQ